jgi:hypothetical protein
MKDGKLEVGDGLYYIENGYTIRKYGDVVRVTKTQAIVKLFTDSRGADYTRKVYIELTDGTTHEIGAMRWEVKQLSLIDSDVDEKLNEQKKRDILLFTIRDMMEKSRRISTEKLIRIVDILKEEV